MSIFEGMSHDVVGREAFSGSDNVWLIDLLDKRVRVAETKPAKGTPFSEESQARRLFEAGHNAGSVATTTFLDLDGNEDAAFNLGGLKQFGQLKQLWLEQCGLVDSNLKQIASVANLEELMLTSNPDITNAGVRELESLHSLTRLSLDGTSLSDEGLKSIAKLTNLEELNLGGPNFTGAGLADLATLTHLEKLGLSGDITDESLARLKDLPALKELYLGFANISDAAVEHLKGLTNLQRLQLPPGISDEKVEELQKALPNCEIY
jgi:hypothetical protein